MQKTFSPEPTARLQSVGAGLAKAMSVIPEVTYTLATLKGGLEEHATHRLNAQTCAAMLPTGLKWAQLAALPSMAIGTPAIAFNTGPQPGQATPPPPPPPRDHKIERKRSGARFIKHNGSGAGPASKDAYEGGAGTGKNPQRKS